MVLRLLCGCEGGEKLGELDVDGGGMKTKALTTSFLVCSNDFSHCFTVFLHNFVG